MNCTTAIKDPPNGSEEMLADLKLSLVCSPDHMDVRHCFIKQPCVDVQPAEIYCQGYMAKAPPFNLTLLVCLILLVVILTLGVLLLLRRRICRKFQQNDAASLSYDDIAAAAPDEAQPLTTEEALGQAPEDNSVICDVAPIATADSVSSLVEQQQEQDYYDDVDVAGGQVSETLSGAPGVLRAPSRKLPPVPTNDVAGEGYCPADHLG
ncbi:hypothetical protein CRUP_009714 [Coryphaenoides rupestris]|nr:hypothetical protein CRUP_009714 [Coryphaenoides rupestris]